MKRNQKWLIASVIALVAVMLLVSMATADDSRIIVQFQSVLDRITESNKNLELMDIAGEKLPINLADARKARTDLDSDAEAKSILQAELRVRSALRSSTNLTHQKLVQERMLQWNAEQLYITYMNLAKQMEVQENYNRFLERQADIVNVQYKQGLINKQMVDEMQYERTRADMGIQELKSRLDGMLDQLKMLLGVPLEQELVMEPLKVEKVEAIDLSTSIEKALETNLDVTMKKQELAWKQDDIVLTRSRVGNTSNEFKLAEIERKEIELQIEQAEKQIRFKLEDEYRKLEILAAKQELAKKSQALQIQEIAVKESQYKQGVINSLDMAREYWMRTQAEQDVKSAEHDYFLAYIGFKHIVQGLPVNQ